MLVEIERKFLIRGNFKAVAVSHTHIVQGYLCSDQGRTVRVRLRDDVGYLTIKGASHDGGLSRYEFEKEITPDEALSLLQLSATPLIDKTRWLVPMGKHTFEIDEFHGDNEGLLLAEIELSDRDEDFPRPQWLGKEVTGDRRFYNSFLSTHPYRSWDL